MFYVRSPVFVLLYEYMYILENVEQTFTVRDFREGRSGYSKRTYLFLRLSEVFEHSDNFSVYFKV